MTQGDFIEDNKLFRWHTSDDEVPRGSATNTPNDERSIEMVSVCEIFANATTLGFHDRTFAGMPQSLLEPPFTDSSLDEIGDRNKNDAYRMEIMYTRS